MEKINKDKSLSNYESLFNESINPETMENFWSKQMDEISWDKPPTKILDKSNAPFFKWFPDGKLNLCYNTLDRHINNKKGDTKAIIWESGYKKPTEIYTYNDLYKEVNKLSQILLNNGINTGDRIIIYMPMIPQLIFSMMACWRIGAVHSVVFGGFASDELSDRINDSKPKIIICASCGIEPRKYINYYTLVTKALKMSDCGKDVKILLYQRENADKVSEKEIKDSEFNTFIYNDEMKKIPDDTVVECKSLNSNDPLYILYTSGTTGTPKGIVRDIGGCAVTANFTMKYILNLNQGDIIFSSSDIGWIVGHLFIVYGPLIRGSTTILFEGKPIGNPDCGKCFELIEKYKVKIFYTAPTVVRAYKKEDPNCDIIHKYNMSSLESVCLSGERCDPESFKFMMKCVGEDKLINDHWWQTESGYPICCNNINIHRFENIAGETGRPMLGFNVKIVDLEDEEKPIEITEKNKAGLICIKLPTPPSFMTTLYNSDETFKEKYFTKDLQYYITEDIGLFNDDGSVTILSRNDDMIKIAGHRLTTGRMEEVILKNKEVAECAVVGVKDFLKGQLPFAYVIMKDSVKKEEYESVCKKIKDSIASNIGAISRLKGICVVNALPKTRSGKIIRKILRKIADGKQPEIPPTIEDINVVEVIKNIFKEKIY